ncbi:MAG: DUF898 family protein [Myxococcota bacterium]
MSQDFFVLRITPPEGEAEVREIHAATTVLGRKTGDIIIADAGASGRHAELAFAGGRVTVRDLGSTNGVLYENSIVREPFALAAGGFFQIGRTRFEITKISATAAPVRAPQPSFEPDEPVEKTVMAQPVFLEDDDLDAPAASGGDDFPRTKPMHLQTASFELEPRQREEIAAAAARSGVSQPAEEPMEKTAFLQAEPEPARPPSRPVAAPVAEEPMEKTAFLQAEPEPARAPSRPVAPAAEVVEKTAFLQAEEAPPSRPASRPSAAAVVEAEKTAFLQADDGFDTASEDRATWLPDGAEPVARVAVGGDAGSNRAAAAQVEAEATAFVQAAAWGSEAAGGGGGAQDVRPQAVSGAAQAQAPAAMPPVAVAPGADVSMGFAGTGGELFGQLIVGMVLTMVTFGIYMPWFIVKLASYASSRTTVATARSQTRLAFQGSGKELFILGLKGYILTLLTLGIYGFWFMCDLIRFFTERAAGQSSDGTRYELRFGMTGLDLLKASVVGYLLTLVTFGIYAPWFICSVRKLMSERTTMLANGQQIGNFEFHGSGGNLFKTFIVGYLLTVVTFGIYGVWFQVKLKKFFMEHTLVRSRGRAYQGMFTGNGKDLFLIMLVGMLLTSITMGIYFFWFFAKYQRYMIGNSAYRQVQA